MLAGICLIIIITLLLFFICALRLSSEADKSIDEFINSNNDNNEINIAK